MLDDPPCRFAVPLGRNCAFFPLPCHQSRQRGRKFAWIDADEFIRPNRDGFWPLGVVTQRENWLIAQVCRVYLDKPDEPTNDTRRG